ncbi:MULTISPECIES: TetR family transcriptional regulator [unclassified Burkholderia]|uniref:TetR/AcrR family transcriptional regulator n=1 Tax=unclassified Burkholderia TaxID=2613784 RepID=UPI00142219A2|nr:MULTISPECIES: TetR family transcriptional regulator [unclassified Burkholderia]NIE84233.1 TetR/AcrR family transcriptional regulator [Burkholderia sp. Tr-860]NIF63359.1 TetR/AcrR family transcriptional regulator [Burkholderia sp. Cy-647]NIF86794.1 TetR/AcrR family transcriptional regulator [Burkholderia sp. Cy-637]NIF94111.1 TetR/AcrR family transcriptional regulator [Burkholderia sp. Ax-1720]
MSTTVDKKSSAPRAPRLSAAQSRERILDAARLAFTRAGYDTVGVREIAAEAGVDPAMVPRLFGSKENLFALIADQAFGLEPAFEGPPDGLGERVARHLLGPLDTAEPEGFDEFAFLLRSVGSPAAAPILSAALHRDFVAALSARLGGADAEARAALITAYVLGFAVLRAGLGSPALEAAQAELIAAKLGAAIQACVDG